MHKSLNIFLVNDDVRMVGVSYEPDAYVEGGHSRGYVNPDSRVYNFKTLDQTIKVDDYVIIPTNTRHGFTVAKVAEVDIEPDLDSKTEYNWIAGKMDYEAYESLIKEESLVIATIEAAQKKQKRKKLREDLEFHKMDELKQLDLSKDSLEAPTKD